MPEHKPVVTSPRSTEGVTVERAAAWGRVSWTMAFAIGLVGGAALYTDGGLPAGKAVASAAVIGIAVMMLMRVVGAARGLGSIVAFKQKDNRTRIALGLAVFGAILGGSGVYFHDGAPLKDALLTAAALAVTCFVAGYLKLTVTQGS